MKRVLMIVAVLLMLCASAAAAIFDPVSYAHTVLTDRYGYTEEEAARFVFEDDGAGTLLFHDAAHPDWTYVLTYNETRWENLSTPFTTDDGWFPGESAVRDTLHKARENAWFTEWTPEHREALEAWMIDSRYNIHIRPDFRNLLSNDHAEPVQIINGFFICCYGEEYGWSVALAEWRDEVMASYGLKWAPIGDTPAKGISQYTAITGMYLQPTEVCEFKGEIPAEIAAVFAAEPNLAGWTCISGAVMTASSPAAGNPSAIGMAAFERGNRRILVVMDCMDGTWKLWNMGTKALYQKSSLELSVLAEPGNGAGFALRYDNDDGVQVFRVGVSIQTDSLRGTYALCPIKAYQHIAADGQSTCWVFPEKSSDGWAYIRRDGKTSAKEVIPVDYAQWLGLCDVADFPDTAAKAYAVSAALPEGYTATGNVHFRRDHSSHSRDLGMLQEGTVIHIQGKVPGAPHEWIQTSIGALKGYVSSEYTCTGSDTLRIGMLAPLPVAMCRNTVRLKSGTGLFSTTVSELAAGTKMHIILDQNAWLYVVVPRDERTSDWLMDADGTYGYVKKADVVIAAMESQLEWSGK